jgi:tetratricopeptide (TPR) repeat protein
MGSERHSEPYLYYAGNGVFRSGRSGDDAAGATTGYISSYGKRLKKAESLLEQVVSFAPEGWKAFSERNDSIFCAFWDTVEMNRCIREQPDRIVISSFPSYSRAYYLLGFIAVEKGNTERALVQLNKGLALQPDHPVILLEKAAVLSMRKQPEEAYECYVLAEKPHFASTLMIIARALRGQGVTLIDLNRLDEAEVCLQNSLKYEPDNKVAINEIGYIRRLRSGEAAPGVEVKIKKVKVK